MIIRSLEQTTPCYLSTHCGAQLLSLESQTNYETCTVLQELWQHIQRVHSSGVGDEEHAAPPHTHNVHTLPPSEATQPSRVSIAQHTTAGWETQCCCGVLLQLLGGTSPTLLSSLAEARKSSREGEG